MSEFKNWFKENQALVIALVVQLVIGGAYLVNLEARTSILESRGSPHLQEINTRLTTLEKLTDSNKESIDRVKDILLKNFNINIQAYPAPTK